MQPVRIKFKSNQEAINLFFMIELKDILERLLYTGSGIIS